MEIIGIYNTGSATVEIGSRSIYATIQPLGSTKIYGITRDDKGQLVFYTRAEKGADDKPSSLTEFSKTLYASNFSAIPNYAKTLIISMMQNRSPQDMIDAKLRHANAHHEMPTTHSTIPTQHPSPEPTIPPPQTPQKQATHTHAASFVQPTLTIQTDGTCAIITAGADEKPLEIYCSKQPITGKIPTLKGEAEAQPFGSGTDSANNLRHNKKLQDSLPPEKLEEIARLNAGGTPIIVEPYAGAPVAPLHASSTRTQPSKPSPTH